MPNQTIDLTSYDPEAAAIQRQRQLADLLQQQSQEPLQSLAPNAPISPLSGLAKMLKAYNSRKLAEKADTDAAALQTTRGQQLAGMLSKQYQVPGQAAQGVNLPNIGGTGYDTTQGAVSDATAARPTTPQEQIANSLSMIGSNNPQARQLGAPLYEQALQKQQNAPYYQSVIAAAPANVQPMLLAALKSGDTASIDKYATTAMGKMTPQAVNQATPVTLEQAGIDPKTVPPGTKVFKKPDGTYDIQKPSDMASQGRFGQEINLAQQRAAAAAGATGGTTNDQIANWANNVHSGLATIRQVPMAIRTKVSDYLAGQTSTLDSPEVATKWTRASSLITAPYTKLSQYQLASDAQPYIQRMAAAKENPGSIGDADLLDSLIKLNTGGNAITEAQANLVTGGRSILDSLGVLKNKLDNGGVLSDNQRQQIIALGQQTSKNYMKGWEPQYKALTDQLKSANVPKRYWTIPDIGSFANSSGFGGGNPAPAAGKPTVSNW